MIHKEKGKFFLLINFFFLFQRFINFDKLKAVAKELGETMNNDEL